MIELATTVVSSKGGRLITITLQPFGKGSWFAAFAGPSPEDIEWARIFWGQESTKSDGGIDRLKDHVEKRVRETKSEWKGWTYHSREELPGTGHMN